MHSLSIISRNGGYMAPGLLTLMSKPKVKHHRLAGGTSLYVKCRIYDCVALIYQGLERKSSNLKSEYDHVLQYLSKWIALLCDVLGRECAKKGKNCTLWRWCQTHINRYLDKMMVVPAVWPQTATECNAISVTSLAVKVLLWINAVYFLVASSFSKHVVARHQCTSFVTCSVGSLLFMKRSITWILKYVGA